MTVITSQLPIAHWHKAVGDPTLADAILDHVVHNAYKINLSGRCACLISHYVGIRYDICLFFSINIGFVNFCDLPRATQR